MKHLRSIGAFMVGCGILCLVVAYDKYVTAEATAKAVTERLEGVEFEAVGVPIESTVAGFIGVTLLVAGIQCFATWRAIEKQKDNAETAELLQNE